MVVPNFFLVKLLVLFKINNAFALSYDCVYDSNVVIHLTDTFIQANLMVQFTGKQAEKNLG